MQLLVKNYNNVKVQNQILAVYVILENNHKQQDTRANLKWEEEFDTHMVCLRAV